MFWENGDISCHVKLRTSFAFLTLSFFPFLSLLESIFLGIFLILTLNCNICETVKAFDLIPTLRAKPLYQLSAISYVLLLWQNWWDYMQLNRDWVALENPQIDTLHPHFEKTTMTTYKSQYIYKLVRPMLTQKYIHVKPL